MEGVNRVSSNTARLLLAIENSDIDQVKELVTKDDCDVTYIEPEYGFNPLMIASAVGNEEIVQILLDNGAPWNAVDKEYRCAGDYAVMKGHQNIVDLLLKHGVISEMILGSMIDKDRRTLSSNYLNSKIKYTGDKLMDSDGLAVMMDWEKDLMVKHAAYICHADNQLLNDDEEPSAKSKKKSVRVMNIGFGMGIVDTAIQSHSPTEHYIIEAHPQVYEKLKADGWAEKPGVKVLFGRWQEVIPKISGDIKFDGIFYDPYAEDDIDMKEFHSYLPKLLTEKSGRYSYYNGLCPDNIFFHGVTCEVMKMNLASHGLETIFEPIKIDVSDPKIWEGVERRYWYFDTYYLPKCFQQ